MWLKFCLLLVYICILFLLSRVLEAISWCDPVHSGVLSRQFLDPMLQSVVTLKSLLELRGVSYDGVIEKTELTTLVETSGPVTAEEMQSSRLEEGTEKETNFTSGSHFIEKVEDAKDSVWLVQVMTHTHRFKLITDKNWNNIRRKASRFGVRTGVFDCSLDIRYCQRRNWKSPALVLALPRHFEEKASVVLYNYSGSPKEAAIMRWMRDKISERISLIQDSKEFLSEWQKPSDYWLHPGIRAVLFTQSRSAPLFFSALSVEFPGRIKFGLVHINPKGDDLAHWQKVLAIDKDHRLPAYVIYSVEGNYTYGARPGEDYSFRNMELFFKFFCPCLNDVFIISFCVANVMSWLEFFITNCGILRRFRKLCWCIFKYNVMVILLWLPVIGLFQMPVLDRVPLMFLKLQRLFTTSDFGSVLRGDFVFYVNNPLYVYVSFILYLIILTYMCKKYRDVEDLDENWFNYSQMPTLTHLRPNNLFEPVRISSSFDIFGSRFAQNSLWLQPSIPPTYIQNLPTWRYTPVPLAARAAENSLRVELAMSMAAVDITKKDPEDNPCGDFKSDPHSMEQGTSASSIGVASDDRNPQGKLCKRSACNCPRSQGKPQSREDSDEDSVDRNEDTVSTDHPHSCVPSSSSSSSSTEFVNSEHDAAANRCNKACCPGDGVQSVKCENGTETTEEGDGGSRRSPAPSAGHGFPKGYMDSHQCVICLDEYVPNTMLCGLPCGHVFHESCIIPWLNLEKHFCPMCRWPSFTLPPPS